MSGPVTFEKTFRRDALVEIEKKYQKIWADEKVFEVDAPTLEECPIEDVEKVQEEIPKFFATMAYPYMNGVLHAGHAFTLSKVEFATGFQRMNGKRALFPLGFHCTGMPIKAAADKIKEKLNYLDLILLMLQVKKNKPKKNQKRKKKLKEKILLNLKVINLKLLLKLVELNFNLKL